MKVVDFPAQLGPSNPNISFDLIWNDNLWTVSTYPYIFDKSYTSTTASVSSILV